jgi:NADH dehydrogenase
MMHATLSPRSTQKKVSILHRHRIVIVGGGAGGLELATRLGDTLHRNRQADVVLVDREPTHLWKPLLHEVAAGSLDVNANQLEYVAQARWHHFEFQQGELKDLDRSRKTITIAPTLDPDGAELLPQRDIPYDTLVLAIGSITNFFGVPGAEKNAFAVDTVAQAELFRQRLIAACMRAQLQSEKAGRKGRPRIDIVVIGGGATGVELSAELRGTAQVFGAYGLHHLDPVRDIGITVVESGPRILGPLPERVASETGALLKKLQIEVLVGEKVTEVRRDAVVTAGGKHLPSSLTVWAGGIRVPKILSDIGLPVNKSGQVIVSQTLQSIIDPHIFALGDCASCPWPQKGSSVPPRAQAAHQQARFMLGALKRLLRDDPLPVFLFRDHGSLVSLGRFDTIGNLMGKVIGRSMLIEGAFARLLYVSLYRQHMAALHGFVRMALDTLAQWLRRKTTPRVKLH